MAISVELIHSDSHGDPVPGGPDGHFVGRTDFQPTVAPINQMHAGGQLPDEDCADAVTAWELQLLGIAATVVALQGIEGTTVAGTGIMGVVNGFHAFGIPCHIESGPMEPGWIMQPASGILVAPADSGAFVAASQGTRVVVDASPVGPSPAAHGEEPMNGKQYNAPDGSHLAYVDGAGTLYDGHLTAVGWEFVPVIANVKVGGFIDAATLGVPNIWCLGSLGGGLANSSRTDLVHMAFVDGTWQRQKQ